MEKNNKVKYNGNGMDHPSIHKNPLFIALKEAGVNDMTAVDAVLSATLLGSHIAIKEDLANHPTKEDLKSVVANLATKEDLKNYPTKEEMKEELKNALADYVTKADLYKAINSQTKWIVGTVIAVGLMVVGLLM